MYNHIGFYLAKNVAQPLAAEFGDRLEHMTKNVKLLLIHVLSGVLHDLEICPAMDECSFVTYCDEREIPDDLLADVLPLLQLFDEYDSKTVETILIVLVLSMQQ